MPCWLTCAHMFGQRNKHTSSATEPTDFQRDLGAKTCLCPGLKNQAGCSNPDASEATYKCILCPFRSFSRRSSLLTHVEKYHKAEKNFVTVKQQFAVACAIFEQKQALRWAGWLLMIYVTCHY